MRLMYISDQLMCVMHLLVIGIHGSFLLLYRKLFVLAVLSADGTVVETKRRKMENVVFEGVFY